MNVIVVTDAYLPSLSTASIEAYNTVSLLARKGNKVLVVAPSRTKESYEENGVLYLNEKEQKKLGNSLKSRILSFKADIIHSFSLKMEGMINEVYRRLHISIVKTLSPRKGNLCCDEVIVRTIQERNELRSYNKDIYITTLAMGIDFNPFTSLHISKDRINAFRAENKIGSDTKVFIAVEPLNTTSALSQLIKLFAAFHLAHSEIDARLFILGEGSEEKNLELLAHSLHIPEYVTLPGYITYEELPFYFSFANLYVSINRTKEEAMCLIMDAMNIPYLIYSDSPTPSDHTYNSEQIFTDNAYRIVTGEVGSLNEDVASHDIENYYLRLMEVYTRAKRKAW